MEDPVHCRTHPFHCSQMNWNSWQIQVVAIGLYTKTTNLGENALSVWSLLLYSWRWRWEEWYHLFRFLQWLAFSASNLNFSDKLIRSPYVPTNAGPNGCFCKTCSYLLPYICTRRNIFIRITSWSHHMSYSGCKVYAFGKIVHPPASSNSSCLELPYQICCWPIR